MGRQFITGDKELEKTLSKLSDKSADRVARSTIGAGVSVMRAAIKKAAPVGATGALKKSIGSRLQKAQKGKPAVAKAGVNVGKRKKVAAGMEGRNKRVPHVHLVALGTAKRFREKVGGRFSYLSANDREATSKQRYTGVMPENEFVRQSVIKARNKTFNKMAQRAEKKLTQEAAKYASAKGRG